MSRRLIRRVQHALIDFIAWIDGTSRDPNYRDLTDWASDHVTPNDPQVLPAEPREPGPFGMARYDR